MTSRFLAGAVCATTLLLGTCANADPGVYPMSNFLAMFSAVPRQVVNYPNKYEPGTVIVNTHERRLYLILGKGQAMRIRYRRRPRRLHLGGGVDRHR